MFFHSFSLQTVLEHPQRTSAWFFAQFLVLYRCGSGSYLDLFAFLSVNPLKVGVEGLTNNTEETHSVLRFEENYEGL